jgi:hypothetical protein
MKNRAGSGARKDPGSALALAVGRLVFTAIEAIYLNDFYKRNEESRKASDQLEAANSQIRRHIAELRSATQKINAIFARLNDGIVRVSGNEGRLPTPGRNPNGNLEYEDSKVAKSLREYGFVVKSVQQARHETSICFEAGSNHLELHRLLPLLAEQENSNAFLFVDKLDLVRPVEVPAFSMNPTGLETRLLIRVLTGPK